MKNRRVPTEEKDHSGPRKSHHSEKFKNSLIIRVNRLEGQMRGINRLIANDTYCDEVLHQISSIQSSLSSLGTQLLEHHLKNCVANQIKQGHDEVINDFIKTIKKLTK